MLLKSSTVLSCLLPARLGLGSNHRADSPRDQEKKDGRHHARLAEPELDSFRGNALPPYPASDHPTLPRAALAPPLLIPDGGIGESPVPPNRSLGTPSRLKRSSCTTFFAFSSKRRSVHGAPIVHIPHVQQDLLVPPHSVSGRWVSGSAQAQVHLINPSSIPSPLQTDDEEYYYSYYASLSPNLPSHPATLRQDQTNVSPSKQPSSRPQDHVGNMDLDPLRSSPTDSPTHIHHPYAYSTPLSSTAYSKTIDIAPPLRHATSQPLQLYPHEPPSDVGTRIAPPSQLGHETSRGQPELLQPKLKTSVSTPNLASGAAPVRSRSLLRKKPPRPKGQERWLSAETWWDALLSPSPRFKVKETSRHHAATCRNLPNLVSRPAQDQPDDSLGVTFPSASASRPRAASATHVTPGVRPLHRVLTRSRSAADILDQPSTSATLGFEPALETLVDEPTLMSDQVSGSDAEFLPLSLTRVIDEGEAFEQQRAQWKQQASKSLGNKHTRSFSRARSKSLGSRHSHGHHTSESGKAQLNLEFLAARTLLGNQCTMPIVHVTKPSNSSSHSKAYSHSHSQSACSYSHTSHSRAYSHSHSHSLTTNSSKSSRHPPSRGLSRNESWSKTALLKASVLCGIDQDEPFNASAEENALSSSRDNVHGTVDISTSTNAEGPPDPAKPPALQNIPGGEVGIAITSSTPLEGYFDLKAPGHPYVSGPQYQEDEQESRWSAKCTHASSEYAGPHPSAIDSNLPQLDVASDVSLRHRLPPRAAIHPPISPIAHPYRSAPAQLGRVDAKGGDGTALKLPQVQEPTEQRATHASYPHISLSHADFEQYGVGEALVYASRQRRQEIRPANAPSETSPTTELPPPEEQTSPRESVILQSDELDASSSVINSPPSLTSSTIRMVVSAFDNPDELHEFQDLFYKPHAFLSDQHQEAVTADQVPTDVHTSVSSSPFTHLVHKLGEVHDQQDPSRSPSGPTRSLGSGSQDHPSNESRTNFVFMDLPQASSSLPELSSQMHLPIQEGGEYTVPPAMVIPEDVDSSYATSVMNSPSEEYENDTFGHPVGRSQLEVTISPAQSVTRTSSYLSTEEDEDEEDGRLVPVRRRYGLSSADAIRSSYLTTSDASQISALSDFPLPPSVNPDGQPDHMSILQAHYGAMPSPGSQSRDQREDGTEVEQESRGTDDEDEIFGDVDEALRALRMAARVTSFESRASTFGGSDDMDFIAQLHQARRSS